MKKSRIAFLLTFAPAVLAAQSATSSTAASADVSAKAGRTSVNGNAGASSNTSMSTDIPSTYSAESRTKLNTTFAAAREKNLPERPIRDRIAEGRAKGAVEGQVVIAAQRTYARMAAAQEAMVRAGRTPSQDEVEGGEHAMARGATEFQIEAIARRTPPERSVEVALEVLAGLQARGMSSERAVAQIVSRLEARASDAAIRELAVNANAAAGVNATAGAPGVAAGAAAGAAGGAAVGATGAGASVAGGAVAGVGAVIKPPRN